MSDDLRALLGDRYDEVISEAARQMHIAHWVEAMQPLDGERPEVQAARVWEATPEPREHFIPLAEVALAAVLPDLLAAERERADAAEAKAARYARYVRHYAEEERKLCGWCHKTPVGVAEIGGRRYCHDGASPTCYELASRRHTILAEMVDCALEACLYEATSGSARGIR